MSGNGYAKEYIKDLDLKDTNYIHSKHDVKYFINDGLVSFYKSIDIVLKSYGIHF